MRFRKAVALAIITVRPVFSEMGGQGSEGSDSGFGIVPWVIRKSWSDREIPLIVTEKYRRDKRLSTCIQRSRRGLSACDAQAGGTHAARSPTRANRQSATPQEDPQSGVPRRHRLGPGAGRTQIESVPRVVVRRTTG